LQWLNKERIPPGTWPFLNVTRIVLEHFESSLEAVVDLTEGNDGVTITGCIRAYRQALNRRVLDLAQSTTTCWNSGHPIGAIVCARSLLETIATFHSFLKRAEAATKQKDWAKVGRLIDAYSFSSSSDGPKKKLGDDDPPTIGRIVKEFAKDTQPGAEKFWDQICDAAHPNGQRMMHQAGILAGNAYTAKSLADSEGELFVAVYNALYSCCWLSNAIEDFEILLAVIRSGEPLPDDHELIVAKKIGDELVSAVSKTLPQTNIGPHRRDK
jgi:hypothetical protein